MNGKFAPVDRLQQRLVAYMLKAAREAKTRTSWTDADSQYEKALEAFVRETMQPDADAHFLPDVARLTAQMAETGFRLSLARVLLHCTSPGTPDIYQGDEIWNFTLVDPDNRRPVDFPQLERLLADSESAEFLRGALSGARGLWEHRVKLGVVSRLLRFRREHSKLFASGDYLPLSTGSLFAFARRSQSEVCISIVRTRVALESKTLLTESVVLPFEFAGSWRSVLTDRAVSLQHSGGGKQCKASVPDLIEPGHPCELLLRIGG